MPLAALAAEEAPKAKAPEIEVLPAEDLMREHGVLRRVLLIYGEAVRRIEAREEVPPDGLTAAAWMIRSFVEDYHEKLEEEYLFPRFRKEGVLTDLVDVLIRQHKAGRRLTGLVLELATPGALKDAGNRRRLADALRMFIRMYAPHAAREDTVLFPAMHRLWTPGEYQEMGDVFEKRERDLFGEDGFEKRVGQVAEIEKQFGIYELAQFTPEIAG
ncbi:MAG: hemerythrin domain-containing protein [Chthoniobacteraceae bacterium]